MSVRSQQDINNIYLVLNNSSKRSGPKERRMKLITAAVIVESVSLSHLLFVPDVCERGSEWNIWLLLWGAASSGVQLDLVTGTLACFWSEERGFCPLSLLHIITFWQRDEKMDISVIQIDPITEWVSLAWPTRLKPSNLAPSNYNNPCQPAPLLIN